MKKSSLKIEGFYKDTVYYAQNIIRFKLDLNFTRTPNSYQFTSLLVEIEAAQHVF